MESRSARHETESFETVLIGRLPAVKEASRRLQAVMNVPLGTQMMDEMPDLPPGSLHAVTDDWKADMDTKDGKTTLCDAARAAKGTDAEQEGDGVGTKNDLPEGTAALPQIAVQPPSDSDSQAKRKRAPSDLSRPRPQQRSTMMPQLIDLTESPLQITRHPKLVRPHAAHSRPSFASRLRTTTTNDNAPPPSGDGEHGTSI
ncbi:hypothetical protein LTR85_011407 [Meristemomyces frigidus]|nr:hypothetical protein LTR85_011407 [Meristemomyces frigidus]